MISQEIMNYRFFVIFIFTFATVECQNVANNANANNTNATVDVETTNLKEEIFEPKPPHLCTVCNCIGNFKSTKCKVLPISLLRTKQQFIVMSQVITCL